MSMKVQVVGLQGTCMMEFAESEMEGYWNTSWGTARKVSAAGVLLAVDRHHCPKIWLKERRPQEASMSGRLGYIRFKAASAHGAADLDVRFTVLCIRLESEQVTRLWNAAPALAVATPQQCRHYVMVDAHGTVGEQADDRTRE